MFFFWCNVTFLCDFCTAVPQFSYTLYANVQSSPDRMVAVRVRRTVTLLLRKNW